MSYFSWRNLSVPEQLSMVLDGQLCRNGPVLCEPDSPDDILWRAREASLQCPANVVFVRSTAAWIWHCLDNPPTRWNVTSLDASRLPTMPHERYAVCDLRFEPPDVVPIKDSLVTTPGRTAMDLARYEQRLSDHDLEHVLRRLLDVHSSKFGSIDDVFSRVNSAHHLPYKRRCLERLSAAQMQKQ